MKTLVWILGILLVISIALNIYQSRVDKNPPINYSKTILTELDSLNNKIDSIKIENNFHEMKIIEHQNTITKIEKEYETVYNDVLTQSSDSDCEFFSKYILSQDISGFSNSNNTNSIKTN